MNGGTAVVVVTFNRLALLQECIRSICRQTRRPEGIIVINNGSTDGTDAWLQTQAGVQVFHQENLGGAGGFHRGMQEAFRSGYEWIWIMDDDAFPEYGCLEKLQDALVQAPQAKAIAPLVMENGRHCTFHRGMIDAARFRFPRIQEPVSNDTVRRANGGMIPVDFISFVGLMVHRDVIAAVGFPRADYYIFNDDVEYSLRIKKGGTTLHLLTSTGIYHKTNEPGKALDIVAATAAVAEEAMPGISGKIRNRKQLYYDVNLFGCYLRRNSLINIGTYFGWPRWKMLGLCTLDYIKSIARTGLGKGFRARTRLLIECYRQGIKSTTDNEAMIRCAEKL